MQQEVKRKSNTEGFQNREEEEEGDREEVNGEQILND